MFFLFTTLKQVVGKYKIWNEVVFWFTQFMYYNVYTIVDTMTIIRKPQRFWHLKS